MATKRTKGAKPRASTIKRTKAQGAEGELTALLDQLQGLIGAPAVRRAGVKSAARGPAAPPPTLVALVKRLDGAAAKLEARPRRTGWRPDQLLVTIESDAVLPKGGWKAGAEGGELVEALRLPFDRLEDEGLIEDVTALRVGGRRGSGARAAATIARSAGPREDPLDGVNLVRLTPGASIDEVMRRLGDNEAIRDIERVPYRTIVPPGRPHAAAAAAKPWNLAAIGYYGAPAVDASQVKVAVLDTGVDASHPALKVASYVHDDASDEDIVGHGTHVCGIVAGRKTGSFAGGVSDASLHVWKIFGDEPDPGDGEFYVDEVMYQRALRAVLKEKCAVLSLSIGGTGTTSLERKLFKGLIDGGVVVVAAMGNEYQDGNPTEYPAAHAGVIAVGAVGPNLKRAPFSNTGNHIALVAPGVDIFSTLPTTTNAWRAEKDYASWDGTSMATPHVSAAVARLLASQPGLGPTGARSALLGRAKHLPAMGPRTWTRVYGGGMLQL